MFHRTRRPPIPSLHWDRNTLRHPVLAVVSLLLACSAAADEFYVPLSSGAAGPSFVTEVRIVNQSENSTTVAIEGLDAYGSGSETTRLILAAGEATEWSDVAVEPSRRQRFGALSIRADGRLLVTAIRRDASADAIATVLVLNVHDAIVEGAITLGTRPNDPIWKSGIGIVNPDALGALLTVTLHRSERGMGVASVYVPGGAARVLSIDDLFGSASDRDDWLSFSAPRSVLLFAYQANQQTGAQFFTPAAPAAVPSRRRAVRRGPPPAPVQTVVLTPSKDNTLYQTSNGSLSNGVGIHLFSGMTNRRERRRALLAFDVASQIPPGSQITSAVLKLEVSRTASGPESMELHRVSADWGEGSSNAGASGDGDGAASRAGDGTWIHTFFPNRFWSAPGGDFAAAADAAALAGSGAVTWGSSPATIARVQDWLDQPSTNFGWIIVGNEADAQTAKRFDSREIVPIASRPSLTIEFRK